MRWFKHLTDASDDDFLKLLEHQFGWEGYGRWWKLCEIVGKNVHQGDTVASRTLPWPEWQTKLKGKRNQLRTFLECLANQRRISLEETGEILTITLPKLLKYRDEYAKKSGHTPDTNPDKVLVQNTEDRSTEVQKTEEPPNPPLFDSRIEFEKLWKRYPSKDGRKAAERYFGSTVKTLDDLQSINRALQNYLASQRVRSGYVKNGSTWFNNWRDWVEYIEPETRVAVMGNFR